MVTETKLSLEQSILNDQLTEIALLNSRLETMKALNKKVDELNKTELLEHVLNIGGLLLVFVYKQMSCKGHNFTEKVSKAEDAYFKTVVHKAIEFTKGKFQKRLNKLRDRLNINI